MSDFSNAKIEVVSGRKPMEGAYYMATNYSAVLYNSSRQSLVSEYNKQIVLDTPTKVSILFTGKFALNARGTEVYLMNGSGNLAWRIYDVNFESINDPDPYSFYIDIELSGNNT